MAANTSRHSYADLTIELSRIDFPVDSRLAGEGAAGGDPDDEKPVTCEVRLSFSRWDDSREPLPVKGCAAFDLKGLRGLSHDADAYGRSLTQTLFADLDVSAAFKKCRAVAESQTPPLRLRLRVAIDPSAPELHGVRWETLLDPEKRTKLAEDENVLLSRYFLSEDDRVVQLRPRDALRALAVIADARNLNELGEKMVIDAGAVLGGLREALGGELHFDHLDAGHGDTLAALTSRLRQQEYDILYLICHGSFRDRESYLVLADERGQYKFVPGGELVAKLDGLYEGRPRLVVLASCRSAGGGETSADDELALSALAPRLAKSGIAAVLAMQGDIPMALAGEFMKIFFAELRRHGQLDGAAAVARRAVSYHPASWMPALYMSLSKGNISWYTPGFYEDKPGFTRWDAVCSHVSIERCTPILGYGFLEGVVGPIRKLASQLAGDDYPLASHGREDLIQVAQYLSVNQSDSHARLMLEKAIRAELSSRYGLAAAGAEAKLDDLLAAACDLRWPAGTLSPYRALARLPLPVFLTTTPDSLLTRALIAEGKRPRVDVLRWGEFEWPPPARVPGTTPEEGYTPTREHPLVYHFFGHLGELNSLVLTQDDFFDYLINVARLTAAVKKAGSSVTGGLPYKLMSTLTNTGLLYVGFRIDDWDFRMLSRGIRSMAGSGMLERYPNVAVQVEPDQPVRYDVHKVREYLQSYFVERARLSLYWGTAEVFIKELLARCGFNADAPAPRRGET